MTRFVAPFVRDGAALRVDDAGGSGLPVIFQHGLCGDRKQTDDAFPAGDRFRRITLEVRGHGRSEPGDPAMFSIATFTADVAALIQDRALAPAVVGGISMGAAIALRLAVVKPDLIRALILARPAWVFDSAPGNMRPNAEVGELLSTLPPDQARSVFLTSDTAKQLAVEAPDNLASLVGFFDRESPSNTAALLRAIAADGPGVSEAEIRAVAVPTLILGHAKDVVHPLAYAKALAAMLPTAALVELTPKTQDHNRYFAEFREALASFLEALQ